MTMVTMEEAQAQLPRLIDELKPGDEVVITRANLPIARLIPEPLLQRKPRKPGSAIGKLTILAEDEAHLEDFKEYMS